MVWRFKWGEVVTARGLNEAVPCCVNLLSPPCSCPHSSSFPRTSCWFGCRVRRPQLAFAILFFSSAPLLFFFWLTTALTPFCPHDLELVGGTPLSSCVPAGCIFLWVYIFFKTLELVCDSSLCVCVCLWETVCGKRWSSGLHRTHRTGVNKVSVQKI